MPAWEVEERLDLEYLIRLQILLVDLQEKHSVNQRIYEAGFQLIKAAIENGKIGTKRWPKFS